MWLGLGLRWKGCLDRRRIGRCAFVTRRAVHILDGVLQVAFRPGLARIRWLLSVALTVASAAAAAPTAPPPPFAAFAFAGGDAFLAWLHLPDIFVFLGCAPIMVFMSDGMLGNGVVRECLGLVVRFTSAATSAAPAPAPAPAGAFALADIGVRRAFGFPCSEFGRFFFVFVRVRYCFFVLLNRGDELRLLGGKVTSGFRCVHLFAAIDYVGLLAGHRRVG